MRTLLSSLAAAIVLIGALVLVGPRPPQAAAAGPTAVPCSPGGTWTPGEVTLFWLNVAQGDSQLIVGPTGKTLLIDIGETNFNTTRLNTNAYRIADTIRAICNAGTNPVALDYVMASHHHLDHIGYAANTDDTPANRYGNGLYQLLTADGLGFTVGTLIDRDGGIWVDEGDGKCHVGTSANPATNFRWHNAGTLSQTARRWICWLYGPAGQPDRALIEGRVIRLTNDMVWLDLDLGPGVTAKIVNANGKDTMQADGVTPVSGDHTQQGGNGPPSENDYSIAVSIRYGRWRYATAGDSDGEYNVSRSGYTYNDVERKLASLFGPVETLRANHHGSGHSSSAYFLNALQPATAFVSCGRNTFGHPSNAMLNRFRAVSTDIYMANNPCDPLQSDRVTPTDYTGTLNEGGDVVLSTFDVGSWYAVWYDTGSRAYDAFGTGVLPSTGAPATARPVPAATRPSAPAVPAGARASPEAWETDGH